MIRLVFDIKKGILNLNLKLPYYKLLNLNGSKYQNNCFVPVLSNFFSVITKMGFPYILKCSKGSKVLTLPLLVYIL